MESKAMYPVISNPLGLAHFVTALQTANPSMASLMLCLFQNNFQPTPSNVLADFVEATFPGYAPFAPAGTTGPYRQPDGSLANIEPFTFICTGSGTPNTIYGWFLTDNAKTHVYASSLFDGGQTFNMIDSTSAIIGVFNLGLQIQALCDMVLIA